MKKFVLCFLLLCLWQQNQVHAEGKVDFSEIQKNLAEQSYHTFSKDNNPVLTDLLCNNSLQNHFFYQHMSNLRIQTHLGEGFHSNHHTTHISPKFTTPDDQHMISNDKSVKNFLKKTFPDRELVDYEVNFMTFNNETLSKSKTPRKKAPLNWHQDRFQADDLQFDILVFCILKQENLKAKIAIGSVEKDKCSFPDEKSGLALASTEHADTVAVGWEIEGAAGDGYIIDQNPTAEGMLIVHTNRGYEYSPVKDVVRTVYVLRIRTNKAVSIR